MMKKKFFSLIFSAAILALASAGITASAEEAATEENVQIPEIITDISISESAAEMVGSMPEEQSAENTAINYFADDYYDTNGNAALIKSEQIIYNSEEMQFIAVTTKDGHVFYVLINYSAENGEDNVYFLNKVDDYDLYALLYAGSDDEEDKNNITPEQAAQAAESANGRVQQDSILEKPDETVKPTDIENLSAEETSAKSSPMNMTAIYLVVGVIALGIVGFLGFKFLKKPKKKAAEADEEDEINFYDDDEINEDE